MPCYISWKTGNLQRTTGDTMDPNYWCLFSGVSLRNFEEANAEEEECQIEYGKFGYLLYILMVFSLGNVDGFFP